MPIKDQVEQWRQQPLWMKRIQWIGATVGAVGVILTAVGMTLSDVLPASLADLEAHAQEPAHGTVIQQIANTKNDLLGLKLQGYDIRLGLMQDRLWEVEERLENTPDNDLLQRRFREVTQDVEDLRRERLAVVCEIAEAEARRWPGCNQ